MNNKRIDNLSTLDLTSLDSILATPNSACNVATTGSLITGNLLLSTAYCGPLFSTMNVKGKRITNMADALPLEFGVDTPDEAFEKTLQGVNIRTLNDLTVHKIAVDNYTDFYAFDAKIKGVVTEELSNLQLTNFDSGDPTEEVQALVSQAATVRYCLEQTVHSNNRDAADTSENSFKVAFDA
jgi:hypothetical protein